MVLFLWAQREGWMQSRPRLIFDLSCASAQNKCKPWRHSALASSCNAPFCRFALLLWMASCERRWIPLAVRLTVQAPGHFPWEYGNAQDIADLLEDIRARKERRFQWHNQLFSALHLVCRQLHMALLDEARPMGKDPVHRENINRGRLGLQAAFSPYFAWYPLFRGPGHRAWVTWAYLISNCQDCLRKSNPDASQGAGLLGRTH